MLRLLVISLLCASPLFAVPPNIVWIIADDMSPETAAYGIPDVHTPNLDRLAKQGRRYTSAYASAPVCSTSRSAFITGCYQTTTGLHAHDVENPQPLPAPYRHLPELLREAGWFVTNATPPGCKRKRPKTHYNFAHAPDTMFDGNDWRKRAPGQPFFAQFQIYEPHRPFIMPETWDEEALRQLKLPPDYPDHPLTRRDWLAYLHSVEVVDQHVGTILDQLEQEGVLDTTIIFFFADHGRAMPWGKQWLTVEGLRVPLLIQGPDVPAGAVEKRLVSLIDLAPTVLQLAGLPLPEWMEGRPILGGEFPERAHLFAARDRCGDADDRVRAVISDDHLLVRHVEPQRPWLNWSSYKESSYPGLPLLRVLHEAGSLTPAQERFFQPRPGLELYALRTDPDGTANVADDPAWQPAITGLQQAMDQWLARGDSGALPDPATEPAMEEIQRQKRNGYRRVWKNRGLSEEPTAAERVAWWEQHYGLPPQHP